MKRSKKSMSGAVAYSEVGLPGWLMLIIIAVSLFMAIWHHIKEKPTDSAETPTVMVDKSRPL